MRLSIPIYRLKRDAKHLARRTDLKLHQALDQVAADHGFRSWSHLSADSRKTNPTGAILGEVAQGDLVLLGARPGHGKTMLGLELAARSAQIGRPSFFFTLEYHYCQVQEHVAEMGIKPVQDDRGMVVDTSDNISADHIISKTSRLQEPFTLVIDYLQLLDQRRSSQSLNDQVQALRTHTKMHGGLCVMLSQIDRSFEGNDKTMPDMSDVRRPNPLDLTAFDRAGFLHNGVFEMARL
ncbi:MAG: DNA helicase [Pseudomonadota bacterium]